MKFNWSKLASFLVDRSQEQSTWLGITSVLIGAGVAINPDQAQTIAAVGLTAAGMVAAVTKG